MVDDFADEGPITYVISGTAPREAHGMAAAS
jgi:hypothetical protein